MATEWFNVKHFSFGYFFKTVLKVYENRQLTETAVLRCSIKKVFLKTSQNS